MAPCPESTRVGGVQVGALGGLSAAGPSSRWAGEQAVPGCPLGWSGGTMVLKSLHRVMDKL